MAPTQKQLFDYAMHSNEQAATYVEYKGCPLYENIASKLEYATIESAFTLLEQVASSHDFEIHKIEVKQCETGTTMTFPNGRVVCRETNAEAEEGCEGYMYHQPDPRDNRATADVLVLELEEIFNTPGIRFN